MTNSSIFCSYFENSISKNLFRFLAVPDIEAKKGGLKCICEVVTEEMFKGDKQKYIELKNYCDEYDFHFYIIDKDGKRRQIDPGIFGKNNPFSKQASPSRSLLHQSSTYSSLYKWWV